MVDTYKVKWEQELWLFMTGWSRSERRKRREFRQNERRGTRGEPRLGEQKNSIRPPRCCCYSGFHDLIVGSARMGRQNDDRICPRPKECAMSRRMLTAPKLIHRGPDRAARARARLCPRRRRPRPARAIRRRSRERRRRTSSSSSSSRTRCSASPSGGRRATTPTIATAPSRCARASNSSRRRGSRTSSRTW